MRCGLRRAGKDIVAFNHMIHCALKTPGVYFYIFPTYSQGRKILWDTITNDNKRFIDFIPPELVYNTNSTEMKITLINGSLLQVIGSDNIDSIVGTNPRGCVFSEYALQDPRAYQFIRPALTANDGWAFFCSTPRGKNSFWELYQIALNNPNDWYVSKLTVDDTQHISIHEINKEIASGEMSADLAAQEYHTSFDQGVEGSYYGKYLDKMRVKGQIGIVPHEAGFKVNSAWDIGVRDSTSIIMFQTIGQVVRIIDYYENSKQGLEHYVKVLEQKPYTWGKHIAPSDIAVKEWGTGMTRLEKARQLGIKFITAPNLSIEDGIESVRSAFSKIWIDEVNCKKLIKSIESYRQEWDSKKQVYKSQPLHDSHSHACFTGDTIVLTRSGIRQIIEIQENDEVLTLNGWMPCTKSMKTRNDAKLVEVKFNDNTTVKCTPDHLFLTENGWISAENLQPHTKIQSSSMREISSLTGNCIKYGPMNDTSGETTQSFIVKYGKKPLETFQKIVTYTIKTITRLIIRFVISSAYQRKSISENHNQNLKGLVKKQDKPLVNGMDHQKVENGTDNILCRQKAGPNLKEKIDSAFIVVKHSTASSEQDQQQENFATQIVEPLMVEHVSEVHYNQDVWCINVPRAGHFSLANGAIVKNCDALRYMCLSLPKTRDGMTPDDIEKNYQEAMMGPSARLPSVFRDDHLY